MEKRKGHLYTYGGGYILFDLDALYMMSQYVTQLWKCIHSSKLLQQNVKEIRLDFGTFGQAHRLSGWKHSVTADLVETIHDTPD